MEHYVVLEKKFNPYNFYIYNIIIALDIDMNIKVLIQTQKVVLSFEVCLFGLFSHDYTQSLFISFVSAVNDDRSLIIKMFYPRLYSGPLKISDIKCA